MKSNIIKLLFASAISFAFPKNIFGMIIKQLPNNAKNAWVCEKSNLNRFGDTLVKAESANNIFLKVDESGHPTIVDVVGGFFAEILIDKKEYLMAVTYDEYSQNLFLTGNMGGRLALIHTGEVNRIGLLTPYPPEEKTDTKLSSKSLPIFLVGTLIVGGIGFLIYKLKSKKKKNKKSKSLVEDDLSTMEIDF